MGRQASLAEFNSLLPDESSDLTLGARYAIRGVARVTQTLRTRLVGIL